MSKILVAGGTGMIGRFLVDLLLDRGDQVRVASLDDPVRSNPDTEFMQLDLRDKDNCMKAADGMDEVYNLLGIKGSPKITHENPANFFFSTVSFNLNMMESSYRSGIGKYLYTSSVGVYSPAPLLREDDVWKTFPSEHDRFSGWSKRMGELQAEAYKIEFGWDQIAIVRPANIYGPYDNFDLNSSMVVPSLIRRVLEGENPLTVWGDGSAIRDFLYAKDCAEGILLAMDKMPSDPINLGSGRGISIKELVSTIVQCSEVDVDIQWDTSKPTGDQVRLMDTTRAKEILGFTETTSLVNGITETINWYRNNQNDTDMAYNVFRE